VSFLKSKSLDPLTSDVLSGIGMLKYVLDAVKGIFSTVEESVKKLTTFALNGIQAPEVALLATKDIH
jgi:hypothetical protein